jgi:hypothetical protein
MTTTSTITTGSPARPLAAHPRIVTTTVRAHEKKKPGYWDLDQDGDGDIEFEDIINLGGKVVVEVEEEAAEVAEEVAEVAEEVAEEVADATTNVSRVLNTATSLVDGDADGDASRSFSKGNPNHFGDGFEHNTYLTAKRDPPVRRSSRSPRRKNSN